MTPRVLTLSAATVDLERGEVHRGGAVVALTELERALLRHLAARPDQIVSREALLAEVWGYQPGTETRAVDIAMRRLRDKLGEPGRGGHLRTVHGVGYRFTPPPALALAPVPGLPAPPDRFIGRQAELEQIDRALRGAPLLALHGPPGVGKSRLCLSYGAARAGEFRATGGVWWMPVAAAPDADTMVSLVAGQLQIPLLAEGAAARVGAALAARGPTLILLDNLDAIAEDAAPILAAWAEAAPALRLICTTQRPLPGLPHLPVGPLPAADAAALFLDRARLARPDFPAEPVPALVAALDHHPLSLELVAGWARLLPARSLAERVLGGLPLARLDEALARSWALLQAEEARALRALSVFRGGFTVEAAESLLGPDALRLLAALQQASLLSNAGPRLRLLEVVRQRAAAALREAGEEEAARQAHAAWLARAVAPQAERLRWNPDPSAREALLAERENLAAVCDSGVALALRAPLATALADLLETLGQEPSALATLEALGALDALPLEHRRAALLRLALLRARVGEVEAGEAAVAALDALDDPLAAAWARYAATLILGKRGALEQATRAAEQAVTAAEALGERRLLGLALLERAVMATTTGDLEGGVGWYQRSREVLRAAGDLRGQARALCNLGLVHGLLGRQEAETALLGQAVALLADRGLPKDLANAELVLATSLLEQGATARAAEVAERAGRRVAAMGDPFSHLRYRLVAGEIARDAGQLAEAEAQLLAGLSEADRMAHGHYRAALLRALGELYDTAGQVERALDLYARALAATEAGRNPFARAQVLGLLGALAADGDAVALAEQVFNALPPELEERELRLAHLDLARARAMPEEAAAHRASAAARTRRARRGGDDLRFTVANSERLRSALRLLESRLRSDGARRRPLEGWAVARAVALLRDALGGPGGA